MFGLTGTEETLALQSCDNSAEINEELQEKADFAREMAREDFEEDHSNYGEQEEQDFGSYTPEPCSDAYGRDN